MSTRDDELQCNSDTSGSGLLVSRYHTFLCVTELLPALLLPIDTTPQRLPLSNSSSDSDTDGDNAQQKPRLTPATMADRFCHQDPRRPTQSPHSVAPPTTIPSQKSPIDLEKEERERGNVKFGQGDFEGAVKSYTR